MSSHREAPGISEDPVADNTDVYAFVSPDKPDTVTLIANYVPLEDPAGGPNFFQFGENVRYEIHVDNDGDGRPDVTYRFEFTTRIQNPDTFLYNTGPIESLDSANFNRRQFYSVSRIDGGGKTELAADLPSPPCNIGPLSTSNYPALADAAVHELPAGGTVFAGQRAEGFYVDLGAVFDLANLRPFQNLHVASNMPQAPGINATKAKNIHTIAIRVPKTHLAAGHYDASDPKDPRSTVGVYATASRQRVRLYDTPNGGDTLATGPWVQLSRLGNPLFNEVLIPIPKKDFWNSQDPAEDKQFAQFVAQPELAMLLPTLYPGVFPNLERLNKSGKPRADLLAILLTGIPAGIVPGFQNSTGATQADLLRLNMAIPPTTDRPSNLGLIGMDPAGFPNGRRVFDDVTTIELRALAGATYALVDRSYQPDAAAGQITPGLTSSNTDVTAKNTVNYLPRFPYLGTPRSGYDVPVDNEPVPAAS